MSEFNLRLAVLHARVLQHHARVGRKDIAQYRDKRLSEIIRMVYNLSLPPHVIAAEARQYDIDNKLSGFAGYLPADDPYTQVHQLESHIDRIHSVLDGDEDDE
jgi:hypothetical protein